ncbi:hypothetical protein EJD97_019738 [Solanum chilense]|uniref:Uncharacterized protein n=1 Tax=Solanum chilense TaxID=4083 RepID=A0A6N2AYG0_SOLCI|nr:hypothetical protein EJD97_019738 [Solanum chilense]
MELTGTDGAADDQLARTSEIESQLSTVVYVDALKWHVDGNSGTSELSQQVQGAMENMLKMINEVDQSSTEVTEDMEKCKESALERSKTLEEQKEHFQRAAYAILNMLNNQRG